MNFRLPIRGPAAVDFICPWAYYLIPWPVLLQWMCLLSFHSCLPLADREERKDNTCGRQPFPNQQSLGPPLSKLSHPSGHPGDQAGPRLECFAQVTSLKIPAVRLFLTSSQESSPLCGKSNDKCRLFPFDWWWNWGQEGFTGMIGSGILAWLHRPRFFPCTVFQMSVSVFLQPA